jgi:hypothetical protein
MIKSLFSRTGYPGKILLFSKNNALTNFYSANIHPDVVKIAVDVKK